MNGRLRWLLDDLDSHSAFDLLWLAPSLPQTELAGRTPTPRASRSAWSSRGGQSSLASWQHYLLRARTPTPPSGAESRQGQAVLGRLVVPTDSERFAHLALLMPCANLPDYGNPLRAAERTWCLRYRYLQTGSGPRDEAPQGKTSVVLDRAPKSGVTSNRWYAAAQLLLDRDLALLTPGTFTAGTASRQVSTRTGAL